MRKIVFIPALVFLFAGKIYAQDFHLSQYDAAPLFLNPAMTGMFSGDYRVHAHYRSQWAAIATKPFQTSALSYDTHVKKNSFGGQILNYRAGAGSYNALSVLVSAARDWAIDSAGNHHLSVGLQAGFIYKSVNMSKLIFENQYVPTNGGSFDNAIPNGELNYNKSDFLHDANAGLLYYYAKDPCRINPFLGFTTFHLTQPNESFYGEKNKLPMRFLLHGGAKVNVTENIQLIPKFFMMQQVNARELTYSLLAHYYLKESNSFLILGGTMRNKDAAIFEVGMKYGKYIYRLSYDINTSGLKPSTNGRGGLEISVTFVQPKQKPNPVPNCPRL